MRTFGQSHHLLVASSAYLDPRGRPSRPADLAQHSTLSFEPENPIWELQESSGATVRIEHTPRLVSQDFPLLRAAVLAGLGIALIPEGVVRADLASGRLERVLPAWTLPIGVFHIVFPTRRGLLPSVRAFIDFFAERLTGNLFLDS
jgi:DNA-binding transcriptional LysR family regulator